MHEYISRKIEDTVRQYLTIFPSVVVLGARQCGKSTLVKKMAEKMGSFLYLDLQDIADLNKLTESALFFQANNQFTFPINRLTGR